MSFGQRRCYASLISTTGSASRRRHRPLVQQDDSPSSTAQQNYNGKRQKLVAVLFIAGYPEYGSGLRSWRRVWSRGQ